LLKVVNERFVDSLGTVLAELGHSQIQLGHCAEVDRSPLGQPLFEHIQLFLVEDAGAAPGAVKTASALPRAGAVSFWGKEKPAG
jgi:hypothetical protein